MKSLKLLCFFFLFFSTATLFAQKGGEKEISVSALRLGPKVAKMLGKSQATPFLQDVIGIMRPAKGYKMKYNMSQGVFIIMPADSKPDFTEKDGSKDLGGGVTLKCIGCNACDVVTIASGPTGANYGCGGSCGDKGCTGFVMVPNKSVSQYQTPEGGGNNWMDL